MEWLEWNFYRSDHIWKNFRNIEGSKEALEGTDRTKGMARVTELNHLTPIGLSFKFKKDASWFRRYVGISWNWRQMDTQTQMIDRQYWSLKTFEKGTYTHCLGLIETYVMNVYSKTKYYFGMCDLGHYFFYWRLSVYLIFDIW